MDLPGRGVIIELVQIRTLPCCKAGRVCSQAALRRVASMILPLICLPVATDSNAEYRLKLDDKIKVHGSLSSQNERQGLWSVLVDINEKIRSTNTSDRNVETINNLLYEECSLENPNRYLVESRQAEAKERSEDLGLSIRGLVSQDTISTENDGTTSSYLELSWDALKGGYVENRRRSRVLSDEADLIAIRGEIAQQENIVECYHRNLANIFSGFKHRLLSQKLKLLNTVYNIERRAYFKGWSFLEDYLEVEAEHRKTLGALKLLNEPRFLDPYINDINDLPVIGLNIDALTDAIRDDTRVQDITSLQKEIINESKRNYPENTLRFYMRHELDIGNTSAETSDLVTGLRFIVPLGKNNEKSVASHLKHIETEGRHETWERLNHVRSIYSDTSDIIEEIIDLEYEFIKSNEKTRRSLVEKDIVNNADVGLAAVRTLQAIDVKLLYLRKKALLYKKISEAFLVAQRDYSPEYLLYVSLPDTEYRARQGDRQVYLYSEMFNNLQNNIIRNFMVAKGISKVILSYGKKTDYSKMREFINFYGDLFDIEIMVGANEWIYPENHERAVTGTTAAAHITRRIHLDIEPHALDKYDENRNEYINLYLELIGKIKASLGEAHLSISVPAIWPDDVYRVLEKISDDIVVMVYGVQSPEKLVEKIRRFEQLIPSDRLTISLKTAEYSDEYELENIIGYIRRFTNVGSFALFNFRDFYNTAAITQ